MANSNAVKHTSAERVHVNKQIFRLLVDSVREYAIFILDPAGHVVTWNLGAQRLKGYDASEIIGEHFSRFYPPEVPRDVIDAELVRAQEDGQFRDEGWRLRKDGTRFWADVTITPIADHQGTLLGYAKVTRDMTARRLADRQREELVAEQARRAEAERANQMKDSFLATLSHELRTPLNAIVGWAHLLQMQNLAPEVKKAVDVILRNAVAQTQLISDILDISRISTGKVHLHIQPVHLEKVVQAAADAVAPAAAARQIQLDLRLGEGACLLAGDPDRLQQIVWNLLSNAVKFTPLGGRVDIRLERLGTSVRLQVSDTGAGIAKDVLPHVFERFWQADSSPTRAHGGLGLGLAIVRHLAELHGGRVQVVSPGLGQGATFTVELPAVASHDVVSFVASEPGPGALYGLHVLVVDDDQDSREVTGQMLERTGATVDLAASAAEGFLRLHDRRPDVLICDIEMPHESGYDLIERIRALTPEVGGLVPAIALTAFARPEDRLRALSTGFQNHVPKPVRPADLIRAIGAAVGRVREP